MSQYKDEEKEEGFSLLDSTLSVLIGVNVPIYSESMERNLSSILFVKK